MTIKQISIKLRKNRLFWLGLAGIIILCGFGIYQFFTNPERVFWGMINNSLTTKSVNVEVESKGLKQISQMDTSKMIVHSVTKLSGANGSVEEETIGTKTNDFLQYVKIESKLRKVDPLKVVKTWGKVAGSRLLTEVILGLDSNGNLTGTTAVPIGNVGQDKRQALLDTIHSLNVYDIDYKKVQKKTENGHRVYVYGSKISPVAYVIMMKQFAGDLGLDNLKDVDPNLYSNFSPLEVDLSVDVMSRQLISVQPKGVSSSQKYTGYGIETNTVLPAKTVPIQDLLQRFNSL